MKTTIACLVSLAFVLPATAQPPFPKPGPEHELLKRLEGEWEATGNAGGMESKGTMIYKMGVGGLWLVGDFRGEFAGGKFEGKGLDSYDPMKKKYVSVWIDSMSGAPLVSEGTFDKDGKILTMTGEGPGMDGKPTKYKMVTEHKDKETVVFTLSSPDKDGKEQVMMVINYKRKR